MQAPGPWVTDYMCSGEPAAACGPHSDLPDAAMLACWGLAGCLQLRPLAGGGAKREHAGTTRIAWMLGMPGFPFRVSSAPAPRP